MRRRSIMALTADEFLPVARAMNAVIDFRLRQWEGLEPVDAVHSDPDVRVLDAWLRSVAQQDAATRRTKGGTQ